MLRNPSDRSVQWWPLFHRISADKDPSNAYHRCIMNHIPLVNKDKRPTHPSQKVPSIVITKLLTLRRTLRKNKGVLFTKSVETYPRPSAVVTYNLQYTEVGMKKKSIGHVRMFLLSDTSMYCILPIPDRCNASVNVSSNAPREYTTRRNK